MVFKRSNETYDFEIRSNIIKMSMANDEQDQLLRCNNEFKSKTRPQNSESKKN